MCTVPATQTPHRSSWFCSSSRWFFILRILPRDIDFPWIRSSSFWLRAVPHICCQLDLVPHLSRKRPSLVLISSRLIRNRQKLIDVVLFGVMPEGAVTHPQEFRRTRSHAAASLESGHNIGSFRLM